MRSTLIITALADISVSFSFRLLKNDISEMNLDEELQEAQNDCKSDSGLTGGESVAQRMLNFFISNRLVNYHPGR